ncbi:hypothetical protein TKK_0008501 [Trichogramma kaykai]
MIAENSFNDRRFEEPEYRLLCINNLDNRRYEFCQYMNSAEDPDFNNMILSKLMKELFPKFEGRIYFLMFALEYNSFNILELLQTNNINVHEVIFPDGRSAIHFLAESEGSSIRNKVYPGATIDLIDFLIKNSQENYIDEHGYTYFHGACMAADEETVRSFVSQGVDINLDTWKCSPLHIAAQYRRKEIVEILLENGANPNQLDHERSTPLHALVRLCLCECGSAFNFCDYKKPVDDIVKMLIIKGANVEARNEDGVTPLSLAVRRFDFELTKALLDNGASLDSLNEDKLFSWNFTQLELKNYPLTLNIIKVMQLLISSEYIINFHTRKKMLKFWLKVRGNDTIFIPSENQLSYLAYDAIVGQIWIHERFGFYIKQEALDCLRKQKLLLEKSRYVTTYEPLPETIERWDRQVTNLNEIKLNNDISLYQICQMSYDRGYLILKNMKNWRVPSLDGLEHSYINLMVKRHVANILIRLHLELFAADLFMTEYCKLNLPYTVCRIIAEKMSHEDLIRLGE